MAQSKPSKVVFRLRNCPEAEAMQVRAALDEAEIETYETAAGLLGIGFPAIWIRDLEDYARARAVIEEVQASLNPGPRQSFGELFAQAPLKVSLILIAIAVVLAISLSPFL